MAALTKKKTRGIAMDPSVPMLGSRGKKDSFDECSTTYAAPDGALKINAKGVRSADGSYLEAQVDPSNLIVLQELGRGASAVVKRCGNKSAGGDTKPQREYVVKCFNMYDADKRRMLREEMKLLMAMSCPSIVGFFGAFLDKDTKVNIVLEFMDRGSVEDLIVFSRTRQVPLPEPVLCAVVFQVLHGLQYLQSAGFMHRDIKPPNLLVSSSGEVKITDFGIGRRLSDKHSGLAGPGVCNTEDEEEGMGEDDDDDGGGGSGGMASTFVGTRNYMSLERLMGKKYGASADVWSLGIILLEIVLGRHPLTNEDEGGGGGMGFAELIGTLQEVEAQALASSGDDDGDVATFGVRMGPAAGQYSPEVQGFANWSLALDPELRGAPEDIIEDDWFALHFGSEVGVAVGGSSGGEGAEGERALSGDMGVVRSSAAAVVCAWLSQDDGGPAASYNGPADMAISLDSIGDDQHVPALVGAMALDQADTPTTGSENGGEFNDGGMATLDSIGEGSGGFGGEEFDDGGMATLDSI